MTTDTLTRLFEGFQLTGELSTDVPAFLRHHDREKVAAHVAHVAANASRIARQVGVHEQAAVTAAWLHDVSWVLPHREMIDPVLQHGVEVLPEERRLPLLVHGKLSAIFAERFFGVDDPAILDALRCHTTLRPNPTRLDKVLFIADKLGWSPQDAPYYRELETALAHSLDQAVRYFLDWSIQQRYEVVHPWLRQAYEQFHS